jgi:cytochrome P450
VHILQDPDDLKTLLNSEKSFEKPFYYKFYFKYGLLTIGGDKYKAHRKALSPMFMPSNLRSLIPTIDDKSRYFIEEYGSEWESDDKDLKLLASKFSYDTIQKTLFGVEGFEKETLHNFVENCEEFMNISSKRIFKPWTYLDFIYRFTGDYESRKNHYEKALSTHESHWINTNAKENEDSITYFTCMNKFIKGMSWEEYAESLGVFMGASYETTAGSIVNILVLLGMNPEKQEKLYQELSSIIINETDELTEEMLNKMTYLDLVIKETLRMIPNAIMMARHISDDLKLSKFIK